MSIRAGNDIDASEAMRPALRQQLAYFLWKNRGPLTQEQFARRIGLSDSTVCRLEACKCNFSEKTLSQICWVFKCTLQDIFPYEFSKSNSASTGSIASPGQQPVWTPSQQAFAQTPVETGGQP